MVTIVNPHIKRDNSYYIRKEATSLGLYIKNKHCNKDFDMGGAGRGARGILILPLRRFKVGGQTNFITTSTRDQLPSCSRGTT